MSLIRECIPPIMWRCGRVFSRRLLDDARVLWPGRQKESVNGQDLEPYWDPRFAELLERWGEGNAWHEIVLLFAGRRGRVVDMACGTGRTMQLLGQARSDLEIQGCDISDFLISKARARGLSGDRLRVCDATATGWGEREFDYAYSIGSLEHFSESGIDAFLTECRRITRYGSFHMFPVSRSGRDEGWLKTRQSFFNNSVEWWTRHFARVYPSTCIHDSLWNDGISIGKWFICTNGGAE